MTHEEIKLIFIRVFRALSSKANAMKQCRWVKEKSPHLPFGKEDVY